MLLYKMLEQEILYSKLSKEAIGMKKTYSCVSLITLKLLGLEILDKHDLRENDCGVKTKINAKTVTHQMVKKKKKIV